MGPSVCGPDEEVLLDLLHIKGHGPSTQTCSWQEELPDINMITGWKEASHFKVPRIRLPWDNGTGYFVTIEGILDGT